MATRRGLQLINDFVGEGHTAFTAADVRYALQISPQAASNLMRRLAQDGLIERVARGRYTARPLGELGTSAAYVDLGAAVAALFAGSAHRVGFLSALDHHGLLVRPVRTIYVASTRRPRVDAASGRPLRVIQEDSSTVRIGTESLGSSRVATIERALLDVGARPGLGNGVEHLAEALAAVRQTADLPELAEQIGARSALRRIGSIATALQLPVADSLGSPPSYKSLLELDRAARGERGWIDREWGVAWPYPPNHLLAVVNT